MYYDTKAGKHDTGTALLVEGLPTPSRNTFEAWLMAAGYTRLVREGCAYGSNRLARKAHRATECWALRLPAGNGECLLVAEANVGGSRALVLQYDNPSCAGEPYVYWPE
jgi:hypothetical protein